MIMTFRVPTTRTWNYSSKSVLMIGVVHGLGRGNTQPTDESFLLAANLGGIGKRLFLDWPCLIAGLLIMNTSDDGIGGGLFGFSSRLPRFQFVVTALTAIYSLAVGAAISFWIVGIVAALGMTLRASYFEGCRVSWAPHRPSSGVGHN